MMAAMIVHVGWTLLHFLWQGAVIACVAGVGLVALRNSQPQARYALACAALLACIAWPAAGLVARLNAPLLPGDAIGVMSASAGAARLDAWTPLDWLHGHLGAIVLTWALCASLLALRMACGLWWIAEAARSPRRNPAWQARVDVLASRFGINRPVRLRIVERLASPVTAGWWRPVVLVPASLLTGMAPDLLEALIGHELGHVKRADYLVSLLQNVVEMLLFYHPAVWWLSRRIRIERERIADDLAAHHVGRRQLALALSGLEQSRFGHHDLALAANGGELMSRIKRLLRPNQQGLNWKAALPVLVLAGALAAGCSQMPAPVPAPVVRTAAVVRFDTCASPAYPKASMRDEETGTVVMRFLLDKDGKVQQSQVARTSGHPFLDAAALAAIAQCTFKPATADGVAVPGWAPVAYVWTLQ